MRSHIVSTFMFVGALVAPLSLAPATPAAAAEQPPAAIGTTAPVPKLPDLAVTMTPLTTPVQIQGKNCVKFEPGTVVVSNIGKAKAFGFGAGLFWAFNNGSFGLVATLGTHDLAPGDSVPLAVAQASHSLNWCPGDSPVMWRVSVNFGENRITESSYTNNTVDKTYPPAAPRAKKPKTRPVIQ